MPVSLSAVLLCAMGAANQTRYIMGTVFSIEVPAQTPLVLVDACFQIASRMDGLGTTYKPDSPLMLLRKADRAYFGLPADRRSELITHLERAVDYCEITDSAFHPATGTRPFPSVPTMRRALESARHQRLLPMGWDLGGMLKGTAIDQMTLFLRDNGVPWALVNGGGDMRWYGKTQHLMVRKPGDTETDEALVFLDLEQGALATSANDRRFAIDDQGNPIGHIKTTSERFKGGLRQVSVLTATAEQADIWATAIFVAGVDLAVESAGRYDVSCVLQTNQGEIILLGDQRRAFTHP